MKSHRSRDPWLLPAFGAAGLAVALQAALHLVVRGTVLAQPMGDSTIYLVLADAFRQNAPAAREVFYWSPLYPPVLALLGQGLTLLLQAACVPAAVLLVYLAGKRLGSGRAGFAGALCAALYAPLHLFAAKLLPVVPAMLAVLGAVVLVLSGRGWRRLGAAGLLFGAAGLLMPQLLLVPVFTAVALAGRGWRRWFGAVLPLAAGVVLAVAPVTVRNALAGYDFVPISSSGGYNYYIGNNRAATGLIGLPPEQAEAGVTSVEQQQAFQQRFAETETGRRLKPSQVSDFWLRRAWQFTRDDAAGAIGLRLRKLVLGLVGYEFANSYYPEIERRLAWPLGFAFLPWAVLFGLALGGVLYGIRRRLGFAPVYAVPLAVWATTTLFFVNARYRLPALPALCILSGVCIDGVITDLAPKRGAIRRITLPLMVALVAAILSGVALPAAFGGSIRRDESYGWYNLRVSALRTGDRARALEFLERSGIGTWSDYLEVGNAMLDNRDLAGAMRAYDRAIALPGAGGDAFLMRGVARTLQAAWPEVLADAAEAAGRFAAAGDTVGQARALVMRAGALLGLGRRDAAVAAAAEAELLAPNDGMVRGLKDRLSELPDARPGPGRGGN